jgi:uncharacterized protein YacL
MSTPQYQQPEYQQPVNYAPLAPKTNSMAIASLISAFFISLLAVILGHIALNQIKNTGEGGRGLAIAGLVIGYLGIVSGLIFGIVVIASLATYSNA